MVRPRTHGARRPSIVVHDAFAGTSFGGPCRRHRRTGHEIGRRAIQWAHCESSRDWRNRLRRAVSGPASGRQRRRGRRDRPLDGSRHLRPREPRSHAGRGRPRRDLPPRRGQRRRRLVAPPRRHLPSERRRHAARPRGGTGGRRRPGAHHRQRRCVRNGHPRGTSTDRDLRSPPHQPVCGLEGGGRVPVAAGLARVRARSDPRPGLQPSRTGPEPSSRHAGDRSSHRRERTLG